VRLSFKSFVLGIILSICFTAPAFADNVTLVSAGPATSTSGSVYIYPYVITDTTSGGGNALGGPSPFTVICDSFGNEITVNETWQANTVTFNANGTLSGGAGIFGSSVSQVLLYDEAVILYSELLSGTDHLATADATQFAIWGLFDPSVKTSSDYTSSGAAALLAAYTGTAGFNFTGYDLIVPIAGTQSGNLGTAQEFIYQDTALVSSTPEPGSLVLFGSGLLGLAGFFRRKMRGVGAL
jgi:hypothetical protein